MLNSTLAPAECEWGGICAECRCRLSTVTAVHSYSASASLILRKLNEWSGTLLFTPALSICLFSSRAETPFPCHFAGFYLMFSTSYLVITIRQVSASVLFMEKQALFV